MGRQTWVLFIVGIALGAEAQNRLPITLRMTNQEALLTITATNTSNVTLRAYYPPLNQFAPLFTFRSTGVNNYIDAAAPYLQSRLYNPRFAPPDAFLGDHVMTTNGDLIIHPINHASFVMIWNGKAIYNDPVGAASLYAGLPKADLILISHDHSDHWSSTTINSVTNTNAVIITSLGPYNKMTVAQKAISTVLRYGALTNAIGISVEAVPAYDDVYHPYGTNNAYLLTIGGKRILMTGDSGPTTNELRTLQNIDVAFVCMNLPYTKDIPVAASLVRDMQPKVVFPYHFTNQTQRALANLQEFKRRVGQDRGIEVRIRRWY